MSHRGPVEVVLSGSCSLSSEWIAEGGKTVVPLPLPPRSTMGERLAKRFSLGSRRTGHEHLIACRFQGVDHGWEEVEVDASEENLVRQISRPDECLLIALPDLSAALLVTGHGYALIAGVDEFIGYSILEGVDQAIVDFRRYVRRVGGGNSTLNEIAEEFRPRYVAWVSKSQVDSGTATAEQISLMEAFTADEISAENFARLWLAARREALRRGERLRASFSEVLDQVFYALDDYVIDPGLRDADDMTNEELRTIVSEQWAALAE